MGFPKLPPLVAKNIPRLPGHEDDTEVNPGIISEVRDDSALSSQVICGVTRCLVTVVALFLGWDTLTTKRACTQNTVGAWPKRPIAAKGIIHWRSARGYGESFEEKRLK